MSFHSKITCDAAGCLSSKELSSCHPADAEIELEQISETEGDWLIDNVYGGHYCASHAMQAANELELDYSNK